MIIRISIANVTPEQLAADLTEHGLTGIACHGVQFSDQRGTEPASLAILAGVQLDDVQPALLSILYTRGEEAAYLDVNGERAYLVYADGRIDQL